MNKEIIIVYVDDIIIPSKIEEEGIRNLKTVLKVAEEHGVQFKCSKSQFLQRKVEYLGYTIENGSIKPSEDKKKLS